MKISKVDKRDYKEQKRLAEIEVEKLSLQIDREFLEFKVEEFMKNLGEPLCDRCIFRVFELQKQIILNHRLKSIIELQHRKPENKLFDKLVVDNTKQCSFCLSKYFILRKQCFIAKNCEILIERNYDLKEAEQKKLDRKKTLKTIFWTIVFFLFCYAIGRKQ
jgi:hypothetical protein